jgi:hypothetical protein
MLSPSTIGATAVVAAGGIADTGTARDIVVMRTTTIRTTAAITRTMDRHLLFPSEVAATGADIVTGAVIVTGVAGTGSMEGAVVGSG